MCRRRTRETTIFIFKWMVQRFKEKEWPKNIYKTHGESGNVDLQNIKEDIENLREVMGNYCIYQIYNFDETSLIYRYCLQSYSTSGIGRFKKYKERMTLGLFVNATGTDKLLPFITNNSLKPRCFKQLNVHSLCHYYSNKNAWITSNIFHHYLSTIDKNLDLKKTFFGR